MYSFKKGLVLFCKSYFIVFMSLGVTWFITKAPMLKDSYKLNIISISIALVMGVLAFIYHSTDVENTDGNPPKTKNKVHKNKKLETRGKVELVIYAPFALLLIAIIFLKLNGNFVPKDKLIVSDPQTQEK